MAQHIVLLGAPASGKGTQGTQLAEKLGVSYLSTGSLLRAAVENRSEVGQKAAPILERHEYLPDELMCSIMGEWLATQKGGWVLDGFPRSLPQADYLSKWLADHDQSLDVAVVLEVPERTLLDRVSIRVECPECRWSGKRPELNGAGRCPECAGVAGPRADDSPIAFQSRLSEYRQHTLPVVERYEKEGLLRRLDGAQGTQATLEALLKIVESTHGQKA